mgnify:FL=1
MIGRRGSRIHWLAALALIVLAMIIVPVVARFY